MFFLCRHGRENLTTMTSEMFNVSIISTIKRGQWHAMFFHNVMKLFQIQVDRNEDGRLFINQVIDEADKNHNEQDTEQTNTGCIHEKRGT